MEDNERKGTRGCLTLGLAAIVLVAIVVFLLAISGSKSEPQAPKATAAAASPSAVATAAPATDAIEIDDVTSRIEEQASQQFEKCKVFLQDNIIVVQVWETGMANTASLALSSDSLADQWAEMAESMRQTSEQTKGAIDSSGNQDYHIAYYLMNDENDENMLISTLDDLLTYDVVSGLDRLNVGGQ